MKANEAHTFTKHVYSGHAIISVMMVENARGAKYLCALRGPNKRAKCEVGSPAHLTVASDSDEAILASARAAVAFTEFDDGVAYTDSEVFVTFDKDHPWGASPS